MAADRGRRRAAIADAAELTGFGGLGETLHFVRAVRDHIGHVVADVLTLSRHLGGRVNDPRGHLIVAVVGALTEILRGVCDAMT
jgi:hypothetical protein